MTINHRYLDDNDKEEDEASREKPLVVQHNNVANTFNTWIMLAEENYIGAADVLDIRSREKETLIRTLK